MYSISIAHLTALVLLGAASVSAVPAPAAESLTVFVRGENNTYAVSEDAAASIRARSTPDDIAKRSYGSVQGCYGSDCTNCHSIFEGNFERNTGCLSATSVACLIISNLDDANVQFWNGGACSGRNTVYRGCGQNSAHVQAPGTNSLGVHIGC